MRCGEIAEIVVRPKYGFAAGSALPVGVVPGSTLLYRVEMVAMWEVEDISLEQDGTLLLEHITPGSALKGRPQHGTAVVASYSLALRQQGGPELHEGDRGEEVTVQLGGRESGGLSLGLEMALGSMLPGGKARLSLGPGYHALHHRGEAVLVGECSLHGIQPDTAARSTGRGGGALERAAGFKEEGSFCLEAASALALHREGSSTAAAAPAGGSSEIEAGMIRRGWRHYEAALAACPSAGGAAIEEAGPLTLRVACLLNLALCAERLRLWERCRVWCGAALDLDPWNVKALYRRGKATTQLGDYGSAINDLKHALKRDKGNRAASAALQEARLLQRGDGGAEKELCGRMMGTVVSGDDGAEEARGMGPRGVAAEPAVDTAAEMATRMSSRVIHDRRAMVHQALLGEGGAGALCGACAE